MKVVLHTFPLICSPIMVTAPPCSYVMGGVSDHPPETSIRAGHWAVTHLFIKGIEQDSGLKNWNIIFFSDVNQRKIFLLKINNTSGKQNMIFYAFVSTIQYIVQKLVQAYSTANASLPIVDNK